MDNNTLIKNSMQNIITSFHIFVLLISIIILTSIHLPLFYIENAYSKNIAPTISFHHSSCITYTLTARVITISCPSANLTDIYNALQNNNVLSKQLSPAAAYRGQIWFLNANLVVSKGATFYINSTDAKWLQ